MKNAQIGEAAGRVHIVLVSARLGQFRGRANPSGPCHLDFGIGRDNTGCYRVSTKLWEIHCEGARVPRSLMSTSDHYVVDSVCVAVARKSRRSELVGASMFCVLRRVGGMV